MINTLPIKESNFNLLSRLVTLITKSIFSNTNAIKLNVESIPYYDSDHEDMVQKLIAQKPFRKESQLNEIMTNINYELFSFGVIYSSKPICLSNNVHLNQLGLLEIDNLIDDVELNIYHFRQHRVSGITLSLILSYFVWNQMIKSKHNDTFARYMLERTKIAYGYILNTDSDAVNSYLFTQFKLSFN